MCEWGFHLFLTCLVFPRSFATTILCRLNWYEIFEFNSLKRVVLLLN
ncbi:hypothetical protein AAZX31_06G127500 [Glycine max]|uniref:Uncharacterized protein n=1 Tax=Glycine max TaxID=3847 RepID=A0A0R0JGH4_SOYBN|nr:hypothetical protein GYH30_014988 [Glycine max]KRH53580.1 hypothetical protein GLYMA_06G133200v4 [Glycine max]